ncbi:MAG: hypothetical protein J0H30_07640, partial [Alphaproteobacteria bacterium]|nr:hypothetical protein [Alphaproteobacteria bacterium]
MNVSPSRCLVRQTQSLAHRTARDCPDLLILPCLSGSKPCHDFVHVRAGAFFQLAGGVVLGVAGE